MSSTITVISWLARIAVAFILLQTLYFKFTGAEESKYIFTTLLGPRSRGLRARRVRRRRACGCDLYPDPGDGLSRSIDLFGDNIRCDP